MTPKQTLIVALSILGSSLARFLLYFLWPFPLPVPLFGFLPVLWLTGISSTPQAIVYILGAGLLEDAMAFSPLGLSSVSFLAVYLYTKWHRRMFALEGGPARFLLAGIAITLGYAVKALFLLNQGGPPGQSALVFAVGLHLLWVLFLAGMTLALLSDIEKTQEPAFSQLTNR